MEDFLPTIPTGNALLLFLFCLAAGGYVIYRFCLDRFDKPTASTDDRCPWKFVVLRYQTTPRQYLIGFTIYCGSMMLIFLSVSIVGPAPFFQIMKAMAAAATQTDMPVATDTAAAAISLQNYPTFPILVAFYLVGLNPNLPKALDFEINLRSFSHHMAYIPKNLDRLLNYMRFSDMELPADKVADAWNAIDLDRPGLTAPDLKGASSAFDRVVMLYARAATLSGDASFEDPNDLLPNINPEVFQQYRAEIQNVSIGLLAIHARLGDLPPADKQERRPALLGIQRDLIKNLEWLYVIFACAVTATKGSGRTSDRLRAVGFVSPYPPPPSIPWDPILKVAGAAALVLGAAWLLAANAFLGAAQVTQIPTGTRDILQLLAIIIIVHTFAIGQALAMRAQLIGQNAYYAESGNGRAVAYVKIFLKCLLISATLNLVLYSPNLFRAFAPAHGGLSPDLLWQYFTYQLAWAIVPAVCGAMTSYTLDRPVAPRLERAISGALEASAMAIAALLAVALTFSEATPQYDATPQYQEFVLVLYGGLGFVFGAMLPVNMRRHLAAEQSLLPDRITVLRTAVRQYFRDIQQFSEWLNTRSDKLDGKRPLDVLAEDNGLQQLTVFVGSTRQKTSTGMA